LGIYVLRLVLQILHPESFYLHRNGARIVGGILAGCKVECRKADEGKYEEEGFVQNK
jgi:hypothetical protein